MEKLKKEREDKVRRLTSAMSDETDDGKDEDVVVALEDTFNAAEKSLWNRLDESGRLKMLEDKQKELEELVRYFLFCVQFCNVDFMRVVAIVGAVDGASRGRVFRARGARDRQRRRGCRGGGRRPRGALRERGGMEQGGYCH